MLSPSSKLLQVACLAIFSQNNSWINTEWMEETQIMLQEWFPHTFWYFDTSLLLTRIQAAYKQFSVKELAFFFKSMGSECLILKN